MPHTVKYGLTILRPGHWKQPYIGPLCQRIAPRSRMTPSKTQFELLLYIGYERMFSSFHVTVYNSDVSNKLWLLLTVNIRMSFRSFSH